MDRRQIIERIRHQLPPGIGAEIEVVEESALSDLGLNSLHLITTLLELQREYRLGDDWLSHARMPNTVGDLVTLVQRGIVGGPISL